MAHFARPTLLAVFAHPDDEAFSVAGTLYHYAQKDVRVLLACATRGEAGKITDPNMTVDDLGQQREQELREACRILNIEPPLFLGYHDSGRFERTRHDDPKALMNVDLLELEQTLRDVIAEHQPQVVLTFDPHGGYGHIDHLQIQRATHAAFFSTGHLPYGGPQRLFYTLLSQEAAAGLSRMGQDLDPQVYGVADNTVALRINVQPYAEQKKAALAAHGTQMGQSSVMGRMSQDEREAMQQRLVSEELFGIGGVRGNLPYPLRGFFDGLAGYEEIDGE